MKAVSHQYSAKSSRLTANNFSYFVVPARAWVLYENHQYSAISTQLKANS